MAGIIIGEILMVKLNSKSYDWAGFSEIAGVKGKLQRAVLQFTPASWTPYKWHLLHDFRRFCYVLAVVVGAMVIELDAFFLKDLFWVQPTSKLNVYRLIVWWAVAMVGLRDYYAFMNDRSLKRLGSTAWVMLAMMLIEALTVIKFGRHLYKDKPLPPTIAWAWGTVLTAFAGWTVWWFFLRAKTPEELAAPSPTAASSPSGASVAAIENAPAVVPGSAPRQISRVAGTPARAPASAAASPAAPASAAAATAQSPAAAPAPATEAIELSSDSSESPESGSDSSSSESEDVAPRRRPAVSKRSTSVAAKAKPTPAKGKQTPAKGKATPAKGKGGRKPAAAAESSSESDSESEAEEEQVEVLSKPRPRGRGQRAASASASAADAGAASAATRGRRRAGR